MRSVDCYLIVAGFGEVSYLMVSVDCCLIVAGFGEVS